MNKIVPAPQMRARGPEVADLHIALAFLLEKNIFKGLPAQLMSRWKPEREAKAYGPVTQRLVNAFQSAKGIDRTDTVDALTAKQLNKELKNLGQFEEPAPVPAPEPAPAPVVAGPNHKLHGRVFLAHGLPAQGIVLRLLSQEFGGALKKVSGVADSTTAADGAYSFTFPIAKGMVLQVNALDGAGVANPLSILLTDWGEREETELNLVADSKLQPLAPEYDRLTADLRKQVPDLSKLVNARETSTQRDFTLLNRTTGWDARAIALCAMAEGLKADADVGLPQVGLYALLRSGLPSDKDQLAMVPAESVESALRNAQQKGIVAMNDAAIKSFTKVFSEFSTKQRLARALPGSTASYADMLSAAAIGTDKDKFAKVLMAHRGGPAELWAAAKENGVSPSSIDKLQRQGRMAFLTGNNLELTTRLMKKPLQAASDLVDMDLHTADAWKQEVRAAGGNDDVTIGAMIPTGYAGGTVSDRLDAYAEDMARKVRRSYPTQALARTIARDEADSFGLGADRKVTAQFMRSAADQGFRLGTTPVSQFMRSAAPAVGELSEAGKRTVERQVKNLQRIYQITPSDGAMQVLAKMNLTSAQQVLELEEELFVRRFELEWKFLFPTVPVANQPRLVYRKARQVSSIAYNIFGIAQKVDSEVRMTSVSAPAEVNEKVKGELIRRFPTLETLFGSQDYCECEHCRSVLSPAAYFVDLLQFIDPSDEAWALKVLDWNRAHGSGFPHMEGGRALKPYDVLLKRRPDLPYIQLSCENTHTALPYIDVVNEIMEYQVAHGALALEAANDTAGATTAELLAEPQYVIREAYEKLGQASYPIGLPYDPWVDTVRRFTTHFGTPLPELMEAFRTSEDLFATDGSIDRERICHEQLELTPEEAFVFTDPDPLGNAKWSLLFGLWNGASVITAPTNSGQATLSVPTNEAKWFKAGLVCAFVNAANARSDGRATIASVGISDSGGAGRTLITFTERWPSGSVPVANDRLVIDPVASLTSARTLSKRLGITYKELQELVRSGFVNPELERMAILEQLGVGPGRLHEIRKAETITLFNANRDLFLDPGSLLPRATTLTQPERDRQTALNETQRSLIEDRIGYLVRLETFKKDFGLDQATVEAELDAIPFARILVLADPDSGCSFDLTLLQFADGGAVDAITLLRMNLLVRLWRKLGWPLEEVDRALQVFVPKNAPYATATLDRRPLRSALVQIAHLNELASMLPLGKQGRMKLLALWADIPTAGDRSLYAQLFLTRRIQRIDDVFDHPFGKYLSDAAIARSTGLHTFIAQRDVPSTEALDPSLFAAHPELLIGYDELTGTQSISFTGVLSDAAKATFMAIASPAHFEPMLAELQLKAAEHSLIKGHLPAIQGALNIPADNVSAILADNSKSIDTAALDLANVSLLHRYAVLAKALKLKIPEVITLKAITGIDPFVAVHPDPLASIEEDHPFSRTMRFVRIVDDLKQAGLKVELVDYLVRHHYDPVGKYAPDTEGVLDFIKILAEGVRAIESEHALPADSGSITDEVLKQKVGLVFPTDVAERLMAMLDGSVEYVAVESEVAASNAITSVRMKNAPGVMDVSYNSTRSEQKLVFRGVLFDAAKATLLAAYPLAPAGGTFAASASLSKLLTNVQDQARSFYDDHFLAKPAGTHPGGGFLTAGDFGPLFDQSLKEVDDKLEQARLQNRRLRLMKAFLPYLRERLVEQFVVRLITERTGADPALVESLLTDDRLMANGGAYAKVFAALGTSGVRVTYYDGANAVIGTSTLASAGTKGDRPGTATRADIEGYLQVSESGAYRFNIELDKTGARADLTLPHLPTPLLVSDTTTDDVKVLGNKPTEFVELQSGRLYQFKLKAESMGGGDVALRIAGENIPMGTLARFCPWPADVIDRAGRSYATLTKALRIAEVLGLGERELRYMLMNRADFEGLELARLPAEEDLDANASRGLFGQLYQLIRYVLLREHMAGGSAALIDVFEKNTAGTREEVIDHLAAITRKGKDTVLAGLNALGLAHGSLLNALPLSRLNDLLIKTAATGVSVSDCRRWTEVVTYGSIGGYRATIADELKSAVRSHYAEETWAQVSQPVFDLVRKGKRDALVAYLLIELGYDRTEQLYEHFLMDPGMEPVVQTSRIRLAIGSVQLFIQRSLLNMEPQVHPATINARHWEWMKRYRVWEANRKIFLYPENWLEPEFRDDKTHLFKELEGALLQGDVSSDLVEDAFLTYLRKLDEIARLDIVGMHLETQEDSVTHVLHVIGRTFNQPHKYFYRRYAHSAWTPWEPITAEVEGDHIAPVIWRDRLYLFWVSFLEKPFGVIPPGPITVGSSVRIDPPKVNVEASLHWAEYHNGEWTSSESSAIAPVQPMILENRSTPFDARAKVFIHVSLERNTEDGPGGVFVHLSRFNKAFYLAGRNSVPEVVDTDANGEVGKRPGNPFSATSKLAVRYGGTSGAFKVGIDRVSTIDGVRNRVPTHPIILGQLGPHLVVPCDNNMPLIAVSAGASEEAEHVDAVAAAIARGMPEITKLARPVFLQDRRHTFYVEPTVTEHTIEEWQDYVELTTVPDRPWDRPDWWDDIQIQPEIPWREIGPRIPLNDAMGNGSLIHIVQGVDAMLNQNTLIRFGNDLIGPVGNPGIELVKNDLLDLGSATTIGEIGIGGLANDEVLVHGGSLSLEGAGLSLDAGGLAVVGAAGMRGMVTMPGVGTRVRGFNAGGFGQ